MDLKKRVKAKAVLVETMTVKKNLLALDLVMMQSSMQEKMRITTKKLKVKQRRNRKSKKRRKQRKLRKLNHQNCLKRNGRTMEK